ncbi:hypothetical protein AAKU67_003238 [Oxalobacteraceae bacterium GrIS 2.11]
MDRLRSNFESDILETRAVNALIDMRDKLVRLSAVMHELAFLVDAQRRIDINGVAVEILDKARK